MAAGRFTTRSPSARYDAEAFGKLAEQGAEIDLSDKESRELLRGAAKQAPERGWKRVQAIWDRAVADGRPAQRSQS